MEYLELDNRGARHDIHPECVYVEVVLGENSVDNMSGIFGGSSTSDLSMSAFALSILMFLLSVFTPPFSTLSAVG